MSPRTPASLLERLRDRGDHEAWRRFVALYGPFLHNLLCRRYGLQHHDACDVTQDVLFAVVQEMPRFRYDPQKGTFRSWLRKVMCNRVLAFRRRRGPGIFLRNVPEMDEFPDGESIPWNEQEDSELVRRVLALIKAEFEPSTWQAFWGVVVLEKKPAQMAQTLGLTPNAVRVAKFRVLRRLREEIDGLLD